MLVAGRIFGWTLIALALLMASGDAVLALGPGEHLGIDAGTLWMLVAGRMPDEATVPSFGAMLMNWPAWTAIGPFGVLLLLACRSRRRRFRYRRAD
jgi:NADPH-dependent ferric siderophore reductase